jgi:hypothetical protein
MQNQYRIWFWTEDGEKKCYVVGLTNPESYRNILKHQYNRFIMEPVNGLTREKI